MADNVKFKEWQCHDDRPAICQEEGIERTLGFAGIHDTSVDSTINETTGATTNFEDSEGTWTTVSGTLQGVGGGVAQWYKIRHVTEVELGFVVTFDKTGNRGALLICSDDDYDGYLVWWTDAAVGVSDIDETVETVLVSLPMVETGSAAVTVAVYPLRHEAIDEIDDLSIMLWFDGKHLLTHIIEYEEKGKKIGFAVYESDTITFDNLRVPQLHQIVEWTSVDPGETASAGMSRVIAHEKARVQARYDGSIKIFRNDSISVNWVVPSGRELAVERARQIFWPGHYRLLGAIHEIDVFRTGTQGHIFALGSDPNALSEDETDARADRQHKKAEENAETMVGQMAPNPVLEPEDIITLDGTDWRVTSINYRATWTGSGAPVLESTVDLREALS